MAKRDTNKAPSRTTGEAPQRAARGPRSGKPAVTAETLSAKQRDISVSEFFAKNRHLLGFDNPRKALLTTVKEAVDNSLDACEEAGILPEIAVVIEDLDESGKTETRRGGKEEEVKRKPKVAQSSRYRVTIVDNGPGIVRKQVEHIFGRLLYGSKFHRLKMSRGQQGIGISAAGMYGLITTGKPMLIQTRPDARKRAHHIELAMNTKTNRAEVTVDEETDDFPLARLRALGRLALRADGMGGSALRADALGGSALRADSGSSIQGTDFLSADAFPTGTSVTVELEGKYQRGRGSVDEFLELTAIANPHARIVFVRPTRVSAEEEHVELAFDKKRGVPTAVGSAPATNAGSSPGAPGESSDAAPATPAPPAVTQDLGPIVVFPRAIDELPPETKEIQPHPKGVELGTLLQMVKDHDAATKGATLYSFLHEAFSRVSPSTAGKFCEEVGVTSRTRLSAIEPPQVERLYAVFQDARLAPPPTDCLAPIGVQQLLKGMFKGVRAEFYAASSRAAEVYRGRPFLIEAAVAFGGDLPADDSARVIRFANRVPLLYQQSACSAFKAVAETAWKNYGMAQPRGSLPVGPLVVMIHMASVWVPFTSESKEAIADYDEIRKEMKLALMECGRKLGTYLRKRASMKRESQRRDIFERYIGEVANSCAAITGADAKRLYDALLDQARSITELADAEFDDEGKVIKKHERRGPDDEGVLIVGDDGPDEPLGGAPGGRDGSGDPPVDAAGRAGGKGARDASQRPPSNRGKSGKAAPPKKPSPRAPGKRAAKGGESPEASDSTRSEAKPAHEGASSDETTDADPPLVQTPKPRVRLKIGEDGGSLFEPAR